MALREAAVRRGLHVSEYGILDDADGRDAPLRDRGGGLRAARPAVDPARAARGPRRAGAARRRCARARRAGRPARRPAHAHGRSPTGATRSRRWPRAARDRGLQYIAITDHSATHGFGNHVDPDAPAPPDRARPRDQRARPRASSVLIGTETNIGLDGRPDYDDDLLAELDWVDRLRAHLVRDRRDRDDRPDGRRHRAPARRRHRPPDGAQDRAPQALRRRHGRASSRPPRATGTMLEINSAPDRRDLNDLHARAAAQAGRADPHQLRRARRRARSGSRAGASHRAPRVADDGRRRQHALVGRVHGPAQARAALSVGRAPSVTTSGAGQQAGSSRSATMRSAAVAAERRRRRRGRAPRSRAAGRRARRAARGGEVVADEARVERARGRAAARRTGPARRVVTSTQPSASASSWAMP